MAQHRHSDRRFVEIASATFTSPCAVVAALAEADPERARALALAPGASSELAVASFGVLARAQSIPDETGRIAALIALLGEAGTDWRERVRAIGALAPPEGDQVNTWRSEPARPVVDRFHIARKVVALWNEEDPLTRARLLRAFGRFEPTLATPEREEHMKRALASAATSLAKDDPGCERLRQFLESIEASGREEPAWADHTTAFAALARKAFGWPATR